MKSDPNIERLRAIVRPIVVLYCTVILSVLAIMQAAGVGMPPQGIGADIVTAFIAITGTVTTEYAIERGIRHFKEKGKNDEKEVPRCNRGRGSGGAPNCRPT